MKALTRFFASLRVFKRLRVLETHTVNTRRMLEAAEANIGDEVNSIQSFIASREPCNACGHHRYKQKTLHYETCQRRQG